MAVSETQMLDRVHALLDGIAAWDMCDWSDWSPLDQRNCFLLFRYEMVQRDATLRAARRRAHELFRSWLTPTERAELSARRHVTVVGSAGGRYRIHPIGGGTNRIERHGRRWFGKGTYCLHPEQDVPNADISLAHLLLIKTDEPAFLREANFYPTKLWDGAWLRRLNVARRERESRVSASSRTTE